MDLEPNPRFFTAPADTARAMHAAEMRGSDMQDAPKYVTRFIPQFSAGKSVKRDEVLSAKQLNLITEAECQRRIDAAVQAERDVLVDLADDIIRASNTLMLMLAGELTMTKPSIETALRRTVDSRNTWDAAIRARGQK